MSMESTITTYGNKKTRLQDIRNDLNGVLDRLAESSEEARTSDLFKDWLKYVSSFHNYSWRNTLLIQSQCCKASQVAGYKQWVKKGRRVRKGETAIWILAPCPYSKKDENGEETGENGIFFRPVPVFDISQTDQIEGKEHLSPTLNYRASGHDDGLAEKLEAFIESKGWILEIVPQRDLGQAKGKSCGRKIVVSAALQGAVLAGTLAHEIGHELLHWNGEGHRAKLPETHTATWRETEAESVSYTILLANGIEQDSNLYLASWGGTRDIVRESLDRIQKATHEVLDFIESY